MSPPEAPPEPSGIEAAGDLEERRQVEAALEAASGVVAKAAADLGISRQALYRKMRRLGLAVERRIKDG